MMPRPSDVRHGASGAATAASAVELTGAPDGARPAEVAARLEDVRTRIRRAAEEADRSPHAVTLVAVSKLFPVEFIQSAQEAGQADFGESRAQELRRKSKALGRGVRWHFVGRLQRNKVRDVVGVASLIHSVGRLELAEAIAERARREQRVQRVLVQVNVGDDPAKGGCAVDEAAALIAKVRTLGGIACEGLMTIPPLDVDPRPVFAALRDLRDDVRTRFPEVQHLSMGMTNDFEVAVSEGATIVRVGEAVFGRRDTGATDAG
jgi:pyridoxal phosphate enzyme (YggS family)